MSIVSKLPNFVVISGILIWDVFFTILNWLSPRKRRGSVVPRDHPGFGGEWPVYIPPTESDSRCACPALNSLANHGIIPRNGRDIPFTALDSSVHLAFNFAPSFTFLTPFYAANMLKRDFWKDTVDLHELNLHSTKSIEHDGSLTREDTAVQPDQNKPSTELVRGLLGSATGASEARDGGGPVKFLTIPDLSRYTAKRRVGARRTNKQYEMNFLHRIFGSANSTTMLTIFGGQVSDLATFLLEERLPDGWESKVRSRNGLTLSTFNVTLMRVELGVNLKKAEKEVAAT